MRWFLFRLDPEIAHWLTTRLIQVMNRLGGVPLRIASGTSVRSPASPLPRVFGMEFRSRLGLAAGFDKDAEILSALPDLGFGFAEIGTVTPGPQPGNERPRLFRDVERGSLFNRMGFNGLGATIIAQRLAQVRPKLPENFRVGINIGKNKDTPLEEAAGDYERAIRPFAGCVDYVVINVSSPNTPGLRSLQTTEALKPIVFGVKNVIDQWKPCPPLLLKLAPEVKGLDLAQLIQAGEGWGISGWVLTNTLGGTLGAGSAGKSALSGGWSGALLTDESRKSLLECRQFTRLPVISVGGIMSADEAMARLSMGADLIQIFTGWIYRGPTFPAEISRKISKFGA